MSGAISVGDRVSYAGRPYVVVAVQADLLVIVGVATRERSAREPATVLASDVTLLSATEGAG